MSENKHHATLNISGAVCKQVVNRLVEEKKATREQADLIWWFFSFAKQSGFSTARAGEELGSSSTTVYRLFNGTYEAKLDNICLKISRYKKISDERAQIQQLDFVETSISKRVFKACNAALISQTIVFIYGDSQIGKTTALEEYARRNNHGQTKYIRMPASGGVQLVAKEIARACFVSQKQSFEGLRSDILKSIDSQNLIIIDEVHQAFLSYQKSSQIKVLEFLREIYDRTQCGMVLCGTNVLKQEIQTGKLSLMLEQLRRRCTHPIQLPNKPPKKDLDKIAAAFGLAPPQDDEYDIIKDMIHRSGLGMYVKYLQAASRMANKSNNKLTWPHFVTAHDIIAKLSVKN